MAGQQTRYSHQRTRDHVQPPRSGQPYAITKTACVASISNPSSAASGQWIIVDVTPTASMVGGYLVITAEPGTVYPIMAINSVTAAPTAVSIDGYSNTASGAVVPGGYYYKHQIVNTTTGEAGIPSAASALATLGGPNDTIRITDTGHVLGESYNLFRTLVDAASTTEYYLVATESSPNIYSDIAADSSLGAALGTRGGSIKVATPYTTASAFHTQSAAFIYAITGPYAFNDISWWTCDYCGRAWRKAQLSRHEVTGQIVCPNDYDQLGVYDNPDQFHREEAARHAADLYDALGEWP